MFPSRENWVLGHWIDPWCEWWIDQPKCFEAGKAKHQRNMRRFMGAGSSGQSEDEVVVGLMKEAIQGDVDRQQYLGDVRRRAIQRLQVEQQRMAINRQINPSPNPMPQQVKEQFVVKNVQRRAEQAQKRQAAEDERKKGIANKVKMAKVRAAKRKR